MSLGKKIAAQFLGLGFALLVGCFAVLELAIFPAFESFEREWSEQNLARVEWALESDLQALMVLDKEYAIWDDSYEFAQGGMDGYVEDNLDVSYWYGIGVQLVMVIDIDGNLVWGATIESSDGSHEPVDEQLLRTLVAGHPLVTHQGLLEGTAGVMHTRAAPMLVASHPITKTDFSGPGAGVFVVGQLLDAEYVDSLAQRATIELSVTSLLDEGMSEEARVATQSLIRSGNTVQLDEQDDVVLAQKLMLDVTGNPIALMEVSTPRRITGIGAKVVNAAMMFLVVAIAAFLLVSLLLLQRLIVEPVRRMVRHTQQIAEGDLTVNVVTGTSDELGQLAETFNSMTRSLRDMVTNVRQTFSGLESLAADTTTLSAELSEGSGAQAAAVGNVSRSIEEMNDTIKGVAKNVENMSLVAEENSSSVVEIGSSIGEVARNADSLSGAVEQTSSSINQMDGSIQGVATNVVELSSIISGLTSSIVETDQSIKEVEKRADDASKMSDIVTGSVAEEGVESVRKAVSGITGIKEIVDTSGTVMKNLAAQTEDIGKIIDLIDGVNEQTSLLALNAAIIAAQAGEHGRGFSVVASEMRELSEKTADSTKEIAGLISSVQAESRNAVGVVEKGARLADEGVRLIDDVQSVLEGVRENSERSSNASRAIANTAAEQAIEIKRVMEIARKMSEMFQHIAAAAAEQSAGSGKIIQATEEMRELASCVTNATAEQSSGIAGIGHASERTQEMAELILEATREEARGSELIVSNIQNIRSITDSNANALKSLDQMVHMLSGRVRQLKEEIGRFKVEPDAGIPRPDEVRG